MAKPSFQRLWAAFPDHVRYPTLRDLYTVLGGLAERNIYAPGFGPTGNTCASRLSMAFNDGGAPIDARVAQAVGARSTAGADGARIIFEVVGFRRYLLQVLGKPTIDGIRPYDSEFRGRQGIIAFAVNWRGATGHIALWNGRTYREPGYDNYATYVNPSLPDIRTSRGEFWQLP